MNNPLRLSSVAIHLLHVLAEVPARLGWPTLIPRGLAARKTLALFGRAEARDFADVYELARRYGREQLVA